MHQAILTSFLSVTICTAFGCSPDAGSQATDEDVGTALQDVGLPSPDSRPGSDGGPTSDSGMDASAIADAGTQTDRGVETDTRPPNEGDMNTADSGTDSGPIGQTRYTPDNGPTHENGQVVDVGSADEILRAIANASPGDVITVREGSYDFSRLIRVQNDGREDERIFLRAATAGTVTFNLSHIENFKIYAKFWVFENIRFFGDCDNGRDCEHAFHIVGDADDLIFRHNEIVNFASHVKLNGEVTGAGPAKSFPDRTLFIGNFWHNTRYIQNNVPHNILNIDGGRDHVVRGNIFADYNTPESVPKSASAVYPKASTMGMLIEQNLIVCEKERTAGETARGIQLGDGAPASICDGDDDQDGQGDCMENGQNQEAIVRNNIIMNCNNGGSAAGIMVGSDRASHIAHNTVYNTGRRNAGFYIGHPDHDTFWRANILENGVNTNYAERALQETENLMPSFEQMNGFFSAPMDGNFGLMDGADVTEQGLTDPAVLHDFCGYPRGERADRGAIEYSTMDPGTPCAEQVQAMYDRIP